MMQEQLQACIDACNACATACQHCAAECLREDDVKMMSACIALDMDCADMCRVAAGALARASELSGYICQTCAEVCKTCADECGKHAMDHCQACAQACRECADQCRQMSGFRGAPRQMAQHAAH